MVHHNTLSLDKLVEMAWLEILTKYAVGEECDFLVSPSSPVVVMQRPESSRDSVRLERVVQRKPGVSNSNTHWGQKGELGPSLGPILILIKKKKHAFFQIEQ